MDILPFIIDIILIVVFAGCIIDGRKKGFVKMILSVAAAVIALFIAKEYAEPVANWINESFVHGRIVESISRAISDSVGSGAAAIANALPGYIVRAAEAIGLSAKEITADLGSNVTSVQAAEQICTAVEGAFIVPAIKIVSFFIIFAIGSAVLNFAASFINGIFKLPLIKSVNKLLGAILGGVKGLIAVLIIGLVFWLISSIAPETPFAAAVEDSAIIKTAWEIINSFTKV
ncbi:MAG: CvpA family protein [Clostridia bacterium]|nr:CvpA family protein [Clostridia bacterium]